MPPSRGKFLLEIVVHKKCAWPTNVPFRNNVQSRLICLTGHGTGRYKGGLEHVGLAILLSSNTKRWAWDNYQAHVRDGMMQEDDLRYPGTKKISV